MKRKLLTRMALLLCALTAGSSSVWADEPTNVSISFGTGTGAWAAHTNSTFTDSDNRVWSRTFSAGEKSVTVKKALLKMTA